MFTGLVEEIGIVKEKVSIGGGIRFTFSAKNILEDIHIGDSINVNGVCQTVIDFGVNLFVVESVEETLKKTSFNNLGVGFKVNLERSMKANSRFGGHFVLGHVDSVGKILEITKLSSSYKVKVSFDENFSNYLIPVGSIAIDGVSLTLVDVQKNNFSVAIIPHTWVNTIFASKRVGDSVNLEFDVIGKYVAKSLGKTDLVFSEKWLKEAGY
jgi:riboflavin synthase